MQRTRVVEASEGVEDATEELTGAFLRGMCDHLVGAALLGVVLELPGL